MIQTVEAVVDESGGVRLLQPVEISGIHRAFVMILDEEPAPGMHEPTLLSEAASAEDWNRPEENTFVKAENLEQRRKAVASVRAFQAKMRGKYGVQPDSTPIIREARDHPRA